MASLRAQWLLFWLLLLTLCVVLALAMLTLYRCSAGPAAERCSHSQYSR